MELFILNLIDGGQMNEDNLYDFLYNWYKDLIRPEDQYSVWDCY
jgi:hypothetical protein